ncbi:TonB-dependent siderophore receptor [Pseudomonas sp. 21LCFQ02]|uniref:TonB-dependent siderophore receptor n=1 Tax=Pseudomonas sp. 21LCFQ02 TaxID=2957505 RepID=UPI00209AF43A|nr:TonB-dependent siderophore receptor [Pseudomonas sp. 21LCFQ02]MCO8170276.1 TonB-dependent siderophore receptor [Pseudomonas sp. 21LCFQ02]
MLPPRSFQRTSLHLSVCLALSSMLLHGPLQAETLPVDTHDSASGVELAATNIEGQALGESTENTGSYAPGTTAMGGKSAQKLKDIAQSVTVITSQRLEDQQLKSMDQVMNQMTGISRQEAWAKNTYLSRGFAINDVRYQGGATSTLLDSARYEDLAQFDSVGVLRGADGLYGGGEPGGVLNLMYKRPLAFNQVKLQTSAGSWDNYRGEIDVTGPLGLDGRLRGRYVAALEDKRNFVNYDHKKRNLNYASFEFDATDDTLLLAGFSHQRDDLNGVRNTIGRYADGGDLGLSRRTNMTTPWSWNDIENTTLFVRLDQQLSDNWKAVANLRHNINQNDQNVVELENPIDRATGTGGDWWNNQHSYRNTQTTFDLNLQGSFELLGHSHDLTVGVDATKIKSRGGSYWNYLYSDTIFAPTLPAYFPTAESFPDTSTDIRKVGSYTSLRIRPTDELSLIVGGRYTLKEDTEYVGATGQKLSSLDVDSQFVPYYGIVYELTPSVSLYASHAEIYKTQSTLLQGPPPGSKALEPMTGTNYEIGIKSEMADGKLLGSFALYRIEKKGEGQQDTSYPRQWGSVTSCCYIGNGYQLSQGFEVELNGEVLPGLQVAMGYTYNANENKREGDARFSSHTPRHLFKLWSDYRLQSLPKLSIGAGVLAQSAQSEAGSVVPLGGTQSLDYSYVEGGYTIYSARAAYKLDEHWTLALNGNNLFDKTYYSTVSSSGYGNLYGEPRNFVLSLKGQF